MTKENKINFIGFIVFVVLIALGAATFGIPKMGIIIVTIGLLLLIVVTSTMAAKSVVKSLFFIGAELSLIIFLAQSFCDVPGTTIAGKNALKSLVGISLVFIAYSFFYSLYFDALAQLKILKEMNGGKKAWILSISFIFFVGLLSWQIYEVMSPIIGDLCIYKVTP